MQQLHDNRLYKYIFRRNDQSSLFFTGNLKAEKMEQFVANEKQLVEICQETDLKLTELQKSVMRKQSIIEGVFLFSFFYFANVILKS